MLFFFAVVGIYLGWFSPTEAAAVAAFAAIAIAFATGAMDWRSLGEALLETVYTTAAILFIVVGAFIFSRFIVLTRFPNELSSWVTDRGPRRRSRCWARSWCSTCCSARSWTR